MYNQKPDKIKTNSVRIIILNKEKTEIYDIYEFLEDDFYTQTRKIRKGPQDVILNHMPDILTGNKIIEIRGI